MLGGRVGWTHDERVGQVRPIAFGAVLALVAVVGLAANGVVDSSTGTTTVGSVLTERTGTGTGESRATSIAVGDGEHVASGWRAR